MQNDLLEVFQLKMQILGYLLFYIQNGFKLKHLNTKFYIGIFKIYSSNKIPTLFH